ncbi:MAG: hypothetical protein KDB68_10805 [Planctomycetes bacterium]|nr:hypothetical protein [Planctomycetota bacterium]MCA8936676.1 hypothetical protein [Planctomycetota bacterium]
MANPAKSHLVFVEAGCRALLTLLAIAVVAAHSTELAKFLGGSWTNSSVGYNDAYLTLFGTSGVILILAGAIGKRSWTLCLVAGATVTLLTTFRLLLSPVPADFFVVTLASPLYYGPGIAFVAYVLGLWASDRLTRRLPLDLLAISGTVLFFILAVVDLRCFLFGSNLSHIRVLSDAESTAQSLTMFALIAATFGIHGLRALLGFRRQRPVDPAGDRSRPS